jgi:ABC-type glycerol-3-phosphate transport system permease component
VALLALIWLVVVGAPFYYMIVVSIEPRSQFLASNPWLPSGATLANYGAVFDSGFARYLLNSVIVVGATTVLGVVDFKGKQDKHRPALLAHSPWREGKIGVAQLLPL